MERQESMILIGDAIEKLKDLPDASVQCVVTSPPYWGLRDYGHGGQLGLEKTPEEYVSNLVDVFKEVRRVLKDDGVLFLNLGDSYYGSWGNSGKREGKQRDKNTECYDRKGYESHTSRPPTSFKHDTLKPKDLVGIPWLTAFALQADGWWLRQDIIWHKPNPMPESVTDRCTKAHEYMFLLTKSSKYYFDHEAIKEQAKGGHKGSRFDSGKTGEHQQGRASSRERVEHDKRNRRSVWTISTKPYKGAHFAVFPEALVEPCILAGSRKGDTVLDPFAGSGTTLAVAKRFGRKYLGIELNPDYVPLIEKRLES